jgi:hypothetical protein
MGRAIVVIIFSTLIISALGAMIFGWFFMLAIGIMHLHWLFSMPTIGYWNACLIIFLLRISLLNFSTGKR